MRTILIAALLIITAPVSRAGGSQENALRLVEAMNIKSSLERSFMSSFNGIMTQLKKLGDDKLTDDVSAVARKFFNDNYKWDELRNLYAKAYADTMTDDEMKAAIAFFESDAGKSIIAKSPAINTSIEKATQERLQDKLPGLQGAMLEVVQKHMATKQPAK